jgi:phosphate starvation-inducible protein PhoH and related proteins
MKKNKSGKKHNNNQPNETETLHIISKDLTDKQKIFLELAYNDEVKIIFIEGVAGTSKSYISVFASLGLMNFGKSDGIIYLRSAVECADSKIGFLPGDANEKMSPYMQPLLEKLDELLPRSEVDLLNKQQKLASIPIGHLRGLNFNNKCVIIDEAQNMTRKELITAITRAGKGTKIFICGDPEQCDIGEHKTGFTKLMNVFDDEESEDNGVFIFRFTEDDIVRSGLCKFIVTKIKDYDELLKK